MIYLVSKRGIFSPEGSVLMLGLKWRGNKEDRWRDFEQEAMPCSGDLFRVAMWLTRDRTEAEDLVQETMFQAMRSFHRYQMGTNCKAWLIKILFTNNLKRVRSLAKLKLVQETEDEIAEAIAFEPPIPDRITDEEVLEAIWKLQDGYRDVLVLADVEELSYKEISSVLDLPMGTVMSRLHRGRKLLRHELVDYAREHGFEKSESARGT
jgi:RNA polymerase sigma-70 factor (ECF subfamily)